MASLFQDLHHGWRMLARSPGFTAVAVLCLALGIGVNSAMFSIADALVLRPMPVPHASQVMTVRGDVLDQASDVSYRDYLDLRDQTRCFAGLVAFTDLAVSFAHSPETPAQMKIAQFVSGNYFRVLSVMPQAGRDFRPDEAVVAGRDAVAIISHGLYIEQFHGEPAAIGQSIRLNGIEFRIIGVAPAGFTGPESSTRPALFLPAVMRPRLTGNGSGVLENREARSFELRGRLQPGITQTAAQAELTAFSDHLQAAYPETHRNYRFVVRTQLQSRIDHSPANAAIIAMLTGLAALVLVIACANVANLLLSRARSRTREIAMRQAVGAGRMRLIRQLLTESLLLSLAAGAVGLLVAVFAIDGLAGIQIPGDPPESIPVELNWRVLVYTLIASVASSVLFGLAPAISATKSNLVQALKAGDGGTGGRGWLGRNLLVLGQVALSLVLLVAASRFLVGFRNLLAQGPGFRTDHLLMMTFDPRMARDNDAQTEQFYRKLKERADQLPGVERVALASRVPTNMARDGEDVVPEGFHLPPGRDAVRVLASNVTEDYFEVMQIPMVDGRDFRAADRPGTPRVAVVNEEFVSQYWPNQAALGKRFRLGSAGGPWVEVVGVAKTGKYVSITDQPIPFLYLPASQNPASRMTLLVHSIGDPAGLTTPLRQLAHSIDPGQPAYDVRTMEEFYRKRSVQIPAAIIGMVTAMGATGLALALIGLYSVVAYTVSRRTREIGIRMAIGAEPRDIIKSVLRGGFAMAVCGVAAGMAASLPMRRVMRAVFGAHSSDLISMVAVPLGLLAVALAATLIPAARAARIDPTEALRQE